MRGFIICKHCHGVGKTYKWLIFPVTCPHCNGKGSFWVNNIEEYYRKQQQSQK